MKNPSQLTPMLTPTSYSYEEKKWGKNVNIERTNAYAVNSRIFSLPYK